MEFLAAGCSNKEIAAHIPLSDGTVRNLLSSIYAKLDVGSRTEAVILWLQRPTPMERGGDVPVAVPKPFPRR
jgi:DNA-binding NarL/FixJ family response regulator